MSREKTPRLFWVSGPRDAEIVNAWLVENRGRVVSVTAMPHASSSSAALVAVEPGTGRARPEPRSIPPSARECACERCQ